MSQDAESRIRITDSGLIRDRVADALRDATIAERLTTTSSSPYREIAPLLPADAGVGPEAR